MRIQTLIMGISLASIGGASEPHIVFIAGDDEYRSEESMPMLAKIMRKHYGCKVTCLFPLNSKGEIDPNVKEDIPHLDVLKSADLMVVYCRWRALKHEQLKLIAEYAESGKPMAGFRTATHTFKYDQPELKEFNDRWPAKVFGQKWITHHGHFGDNNELLTNVQLIPDRPSSPILRGVEEFKAYSWLYHVQGGGDSLPKTADPLLMGTAIKSSHANRHARFPKMNPVAWTHTYTGTSGKPARVFFTTLGHPYDFKNQSMRRLAVQGFLWAMGREDRIPANGSKVDFVGDYDPPGSGINQFRKGRTPTQAMNE